MKNIISILLLFLSISAFSQSDTLFKMNGERLLVNVTEITGTEIKYTYPNESFSNTITKGTVSEIHFKSGRTQKFASNLNISRTKSCLDWKNVQISKIDSEVQGLQKIDVIGAKAKGATSWSSLGKLQDRTFDKIKIETAMIGGNVAYIIEQNTEEGMTGGKYGSSKAPSVTISGLAYTTKKVYKNDISFGDYKVTRVLVLKTNSYSIDDYKFTPQTISVLEKDIINENGFQKINLDADLLKKVSEYTIIFANDNELVLSGVYSSRNGKNTYYNVLLKKF